MLRGFDYVKATNIENALEILRREGNGVHLLAGGTNLLVDVRAGRAKPRLLVDTSELQELRFIAEENGAIKIGPGMCHTEIANSPLLQKEAPVLVAASRQMGGPQTRNQGTIGGNIADASPAADTVPSLLVLGARLKIRSATATREVAIEDFFTGPGQTVLKKDEMIVEIWFPKVNGRKGAFIKLGRRNALAISVVSVATLTKINPQSKVFEEARVALGAVAPTPTRARSVETALMGRPATEETIRQAAEAALKDIKPISDIRASAEYRTIVTPVLVRRALEQVI